MFLELLKILNNKLCNILGKVRCPYPGDPPHGRIAPLKFWYKPGDNIQVILILFSAWFTNSSSYIINIIKLSYK